MTAVNPRTVRLDQLLVERGCAESRTRAQQLIRSGAVRVEGQTASKPAQKVSEAAKVEIVENPLPYVGRGGLKLAHALRTFDLSVHGRTALDVGASTGGFTQVLLEAGAERVYAVDVGRDQLHPSLRGDPRVVVMERTDIRSLTAESLAIPPDVAVIDVSFISLHHVLPAVDRLLTTTADIVALVKPQFEVGPGGRNRRGVVRDVRLHVEALAQVHACAQRLGWALRGMTSSPVPGGDGNREYLLHWRKGGGEGIVPDFERIVATTDREG